MKIIENRVPLSTHTYPWGNKLSSVVFFDIETTGLSPKVSSIYLIGVMRYDVNHKIWKMTQWFADDYKSEKNMLVQFFQYLQENDWLIHFNGKTFDIPYIQSKCKKYDLDIPLTARRILDHQQIDLFQQLRPLKKIFHMVHASQTSWEKWLGIDRDDEYDGGKLIPIYAAYMQKNILAQQEEKQKLEKLLLLHNHDDIAGMRDVSSILLYASLLQQRTVLSHQKMFQVMDQSALAQNQIQKFPQEQEYQISFQLVYPVPRKIVLYTEEKKGLPWAALHIEKDRGILKIKIYHKCLKYFFHDYKNYYYLPQENMAIHKSVAQFVNPDFREKATPANCYTLKEGLFVPSFVSCKKNIKTKFPLFLENYGDKFGFYGYPSLEDEEVSFWESYLAEVMCAF